MRDGGRCPGAREAASRYMEGRREHAPKLLRGEGRWIERCRPAWLNALDEPTGPNLNSNPSGAFRSVRSPRIVAGRRYG